MSQPGSESRYAAKPFLSRTLAGFYRATAKVRMLAAKLNAHALLASEIKHPLPASVVVMGRCFVDGTGAVQIGENCLFYPELHFETREDAVLRIGANVVISRGTHLVAMKGISIGDGAMLGEFVSVRDTNHSRDPGKTIRDSGYTGASIQIGREVWIGRGAVILPGVTVGDGATVGANAVVTKDVASGTTVVGVPARPLPPR
jgi:acetyltransferase-like isoleucine patch superfamily enzyme